MRDPLMMTLSDERKRDFWLDKLPDLDTVLSGVPQLPQDIPSWLALNSHKVEDIAAWIRRICNYLEITPTLLAKRASISPSTINRFLLGKGGNLSANTLGALSKVAIDQIVFSTDNIRDTAHSAIKNKKAIDVTIALRVEDENWREMPMLDVEERYSLSIPTETVDLAMPLIGAKIEGSFLGESLPQGSILICYAGPFSQIPKTGIFTGVPYVVLRRRDCLVETTLRKVEVDPSGAYWLAPLDRQFVTSEMIFVGRKGDPVPADVFLMGAVAGVYRTLEPIAT